jgi:hypothetical protein
VKRFATGLITRDGEVQESKLFAVIGKSIAAYLLLAYSETVLDHEYALLILLTAMVAPDLYKKVITMRAGGAVKPDAETK